MFKKLKNSFFLKRLYAELSKRKKVVVPAVNTLQHIGLVYTINDAEQNRQITNCIKFFNKNGIKYKTLAFKNQQRKSDENVSNSVYYKNDLNWYDIPIAQHVKEFCSINFDVLLILNPEKHNHKKYILATSLASLKAGISSITEGNNYYDFQFENNNSKPIELLDVYKQLLVLSQSK